jgi:Ser/Thr protein kinase RdoA (MazF antagonist)
MDYHLSPEISPTQIRHHLARNYQLDGQLKLLPCELDLVAKLTNKTQKFIIKIANLSKQSIELDMENQAMSKLADQGMQVPQVLKSLSGDALTRITNKSGNCYFFRVLTYLEGDFYINVDRAKCTAVIWKNLGRFIAKLDKA